MTGTQCPIPRQRVTPPMASVGSLVKSGPHLRFSGCELELFAEGHIQGPGPNNHVVHFLTTYHWGRLKASCWLQSGVVHPLGLHPKHKNFKPVEGGTSTKDYNCLAAGCGKWFSNQPAAIFGQPTPIMGSSTLWLGWMAATSAQISSKLGSLLETPGQCPQCWPSMAYGHQHAGVN